MSTIIHMQGAIEPLETDAPLQATMLNMSAAANNNLLFFGINGTDGNPIMVAIQKVLYMRGVGEE